MVMPYDLICHRRVRHQPGSVVDLWKPVIDFYSFICIGAIKLIKDQSIPSMVKRKFSLNFFLSIFFVKLKEDLHRLARM